MINLSELRDKLLEAAAKTVEGITGDVFPPIIKELVSQVIEIAFDQLIQNDPVQGKAAVASLYPQIDVNLENWAQKTDTPYDDALAGGFKQGLETVAERHEIPIANVDSD